MVELFFKDKERGFQDHLNVNGTLVLFSLTKAEIKNKDWCDGVGRGNSEGLDLIQRK